MELIEHNGKKTVLFVFYDPGFDTSTYLVPLDVAEKLNLLSYDREELSRNDYIFDDLEPYEVENLCAYTTE